MIPWFNTGQGFSEFGKSPGILTPLRFAKKIFGRVPPTKGVIQ